MVSYGYNSSDNIKTSVLNGEVGEASKAETAAVPDRGLYNNIPYCNPKFSNKLAEGGEDTVVLSAYVRWSKESWDYLELALDNAKDGAQADGDNVVFCNGNTFEVQAGGRRSGEHGPFYTWILKTGGVSFCLSRNQQPKGEMPNVLIDMGSMFLMGCGGLRSGWAIARSMIEGFGGEIEQVKVSRVDMCVDLPNIDIRELCLRFQCGFYVSRGRDCAQYSKGVKPTGFTVGSSGMMVRVYDKILETRNQAEKRNFLIEARWGGVLPECASRVEFQLRSGDLRKRGIRTLEDYFDKCVSLADYCTTEWFRMTDDENDHKHGDRLGNWDVWDFVIASFHKWTSDSGGNCEISRVKTPKGDKTKLINQAVGCLITAGVIDGNTFKNDADFVKFCGWMIGNAVRKTSDRYTRALKRYITYQASMPVNIHYPTKKGVVCNGC